MYLFEKSLTINSAVNTVDNNNNLVEFTYNELMRC